MFMPPTPVTFDQFGGLRLDIDPTELGATGATSCANVDYDREGRIHTRSGNALLDTIGAVDFVKGIAGFTTVLQGTPQLVVGYTDTGHTGKLRAYSASGGVSIATTTATGVGAPLRAVQWGDPSNKRLYIADTSGVWRWTGAAFSQPAGIGGGVDVAVLPNSNRLVVADETNTNRVQFSDAGAPETFGANNYVELAPGDGGDIVGMATWQNNLFVFKPSRFFVFYGEGQLSDGSPKFNYNTFEKYGAVYPPVAGNEGVYFWDGRYIWLANNLSAPTRISAPIEPYLQGIASINGATTFQPLNIALHYSVGRLWVQVATALGGNPNATLVYDPKSGTWTYYDMQIAGVTSAYLFGVLTAYWISGDLTAAKTYRFDPTATTDNGTAIAWSYASGLYDAGSRDRKAINWTDVLGSGTVTLTVGAQDAAPNRVADPGSSVTLGTAPALTTTRRRRAVSGRLFQHTLSGSGQAVVAGLTHYFPDGRQA